MRKDQQFDEIANVNNINNNKNEINDTNINNNMHNRNTRGFESCIKLIPGSKYKIKNISKNKTITSFLKIESVFRRDAGSYICVAKNNYGNETKSTDVIILENPEIPQKLFTTEVHPDWVKLAWEPPYDGSSPITSYKAEVVRLFEGQGRKTFSLTTLFKI